MAQLLLKHGASLDWNAPDGTPAADLCAALGVKMG
jgi:hypothetical protein